MAALSAWQAWPCRAGPLKGGDPRRLSYPNNTEFVASPRLGRSSSLSHSENQAASSGAWMFNSYRCARGPDRQGDAGSSTTATAEDSWKASQSLVTFCGSYGRLELHYRLSLFFFLPRIALERSKKISLPSYCIIPLIIRCQSHFCRSARAVVQSVPSATPS